MKKLRVTPVLACLVLLFGCQTYNSHGGEIPPRLIDHDAGIAAGMDAVLEYLEQRDRDSIKRRNLELQAAGIGALSGGVGRYMDIQETRLRDALRDSEVRIERDGDNISLIMPDDITFVPNGSRLNADFYRVLDSVAKILQEFDQTLIIAAGHTDDTGSIRYNQGLSERRANSVASYLVTQGIVDARVEVVGFGENRPIFDNTSAAGRSLNRRVEIALLPITRDQH